MYEYVLCSKNRPMFTYPFQVVLRVEVKCFFPFTFSKYQYLQLVRKIWRITHIFYGLLINEKSTWMLNLSVTFILFVPVRQFVLPQCADLQRRQTVKYYWCSVDIITECPRNRDLWNHYSIKCVLKGGQFPSTCCDGSTCLLLLSPAVCVTLALYKSSTNYITL